MENRKKDDLLELVLSKGVFLFLGTLVAGLLLIAFIYAL